MGSNPLNYYTAYYNANKDILGPRMKAWRIARKYKDPQGYLCTRIRNRAKEKGLEFNLEPSDFVVPDVCPVTKLKLFFTDHGITDNTPTVDRIDNSKGYIKGNVAIISWRANKAKSDLSIDEIKALAEYVTETH